VFRSRRPDRSSHASHLHSAGYRDRELSHTDRRIGPAVIYFKLIATGSKLRASPKIAPEFDDCQLAVACIGRMC
jgi:hypothetical protein